MDRGPKIDSNFSGNIKCPIMHSEENNLSRNDNLLQRFIFYHLDRTTETFILNLHLNALKKHCVKNFSFKSLLSFPVTSQKDDKTYFSTGW